ncbi:hypothetical protein [Teichococcus aestuarii]|uniref:hypothetical protein n=1 Tax=Teichococcus aestuarii TaxID=568898 RepID=UPI00361564C4
MAALWSYAALAVLATLLFGTAVWAAGLGVEAYRPVYVLLFLGSALPLPWMILRVTANAFDAYVMTETIDFIRRSALFGLTLALLAGLPLMAYSLAFVALWLAGLAVLFALARRRVPLLAQQGLRARRGFSVLRQDLRGIAASAQLSISEFLIYIFPYYAIPLMHRDALALVAFDMFYKVTRFATTAYLTVSETLLPHQTRAGTRGTGPGCGARCGSPSCSAWCRCWAARVSSACSASSSSACCSVRRAWSRRRCGWPSASCWC